MWTVARCLAAHGTPERALVEAEFRAPVLLPGTVTYGAESGRFELRSGGMEVPPLERSRKWGNVHLAGEVYPLAS